jgi:SPP1 gp7 family putative phage head morphogenesis protein
MTRFSLLAMMRRQGRRRRMVRLRPLTVKPGPVRALERLNVSLMPLWGRRVDEIVAAYSRPGATGFADSAEETSRLLDIIMLETQTAAVALVARIRQWGRAAETLHRAQWVAGVQAATGINLETLLSPHDVEETVEAVVRRNASLVTHVSESTRSRIADITFRGVQQRTPARQVAIEIQAAIGMERDRAVRIAADQATKLSAALDRARQEQAGIDHFIWRHSGKKHPRPEHVARNGVLFKWRAGEGPGRNPPPQGDFPGELPYCGCTAQPAILDENGKPF